MKLTEIPRLLSPTRWAIVGLIVLVALFAIWWVFTEPGRANQRAAEARADSAFSAAGTQSAKDSMKTVIEAQRREAALDRQSEEAEDEIRNAPEADRNRVALKRLCMHDAYANDPSCRQLRGDGAP